MYLHTVNIFSLIIRIIIVIRDTLNLWTLQPSILDKFDVYTGHVWEDDSNRSFSPIRTWAQS